MPAVTYLRDWEVKNWSSVPGDKEVDELLQELRARTGDNWIIGVREFPKHRRAWHRLWRVQDGTMKYYTLYADCHGEWQIINLATPEGGSIFHGSSQSREDVINFMLGYIGGLRDKERYGKVAASKA